MGIRELFCDRACFSCSGLRRTQGGRRHTSVHVWGSAELRGACSGCPNSREVTISRDCVPPRRAAQDNRNPMFLFSILFLSALRL